MSQETLALVTRALRAATRRPKPDFDVMNEVFHEDHVFVSVPAAKLGEEGSRGGRGYQSFLAEQAEVMPFEIELEGAVDLGPDVVLAVTSVRLQGASSGIETVQRMWSVLAVADGKITRTEVYVDPTEALRAVGLT